MRRFADKKDLFETMPLGRAYWILSIPVAIGSLVSVLYNLVDTFFVGMLNDPLENAAVALAFPVVLAFNAVNNLFGIGASSMMSRCLGAGERERVRIVSAFGFYGALFSGLLLSLLYTVFRDPLLVLLGANGETFGRTADYMFWTVTLGAGPAILNNVQAQMVRSEGASVHASIGTISGLVLNILLDPFFILPRYLGMGAAGAGMATFLSNCTACVYFLILAWARRGKTYVCMRPAMLRRVDRTIVRKVTEVGIPAAIQNLLNVAGAGILNHITASYSPEAVAAMGIAQKLVSVPRNLINGLAQGPMPLVGYNYASGNFRRMKGTVVMAFRAVVPLAAAAMVFYLAAAPWVVGLFIGDEQVIAYGTRFLRAMAAGLVVYGLDFGAVHIFQALGQGRCSLLFAILRKIVLEIPLIFLLNAWFPLYGIPWSGSAAEAGMAAAALLTLRHLFRKIRRESE